MDDTAKTTPDAKFGLEVTADLDPTEVATDLPIIPLIEKHCQTVLRRQPQLLGLSGATVTKQLIEKGIPAFGFAPGDEAEPHTANESVSIQELVDFAKVMSRVCLEYLR